MTRKAITEALWQLRRACTEFKSDAAFARAAGIPPATLTQTKKGTMPNPVTIDKWVTMCGSSSSQFWSQFDDDAAGRFAPGYDKVHEYLAMILDSGDPERIELTKSLIEIFRPQ